jgi:hypothetical protein
MVLLVRRCLKFDFALSLAGNFFFFVFFAWPAFFFPEAKPANDAEQTTAATDKAKPTRALN